MDQACSDAGPVDRLPNSANVLTIIAVTVGSPWNVIDWSVNQYPAWGKVPANRGFFGLRRKKPAE
jgi:hypothetical protein